jgi:hypothetical protein
MVLAEMGPNAIIDGSSDLGLRDIDRNNDWTLLCSSLGLKTMLVW